MAYCTEAQVQGEFKDLPITTTTALKTGQIAEFIAEADALINAIISTRYQTPVEDGDALLLCRRMSRALVADRVAAILAVKLPNDKLNQDATRMTTKEVMALAQKIADGDILFDGAVVLAGVSSVASLSLTQSVPITFKRDRKQW